MITSGYFIAGVNLRNIKGMLMYSMLIMDCELLQCLLAINADFKCKCKTKNGT